MKLPKEIILSNIDLLHTTKMGFHRIKNNLKLETNEVLDYCKKIIENNNSIVYKKGKNFYCEMNNIKITINSYSYTIITAHIIKNER